MDIRELYLLFFSWDDSGWFLLCNLGEKKFFFFFPKRTFLVLLKSIPFSTVYLFHQAGNIILPTCLGLGVIVYKSIEIKFFKLSKTMHDQALHLFMVLIVK